ncbi:MAG: hypothetical protein ACD_37C00033G0003 [uncultured bacterium]|nr:MAG: hypothetical protein ACD_37C00033G0003 [uncultured bacterium]
MIIFPVNKKEILKEVEDHLSRTENEILATMLLREEIEKPIPNSYKKLLNRKTEEGIKLIRLGFGSKEEYNMLSRKLVYKKNYSFFLIEKVESYQRMIILDSKIVFFKAGKNFFKSNYKPVVKVFKDYFDLLKKKGKYG